MAKSTKTSGIRGPREEVTAPKVMVPKPAVTTPKLRPTPTPVAPPPERVCVKNLLGQAISISVLDENGSDHGFVLLPYGRSEPILKARLTRHTLQLHRRRFVNIIPLPA